MSSKVTTLEGITPKPKLREVVSYELSTLFQRGERWNPDDLVARKGLPIYRTMMSDEQVKAVVQFKRDAITSRGWTFDYPDHSTLSDEEKERRIHLFTEFVQRMRGSFEDALNAIATGRVYGYSLTEKVYDVVKVDGKAYTGLHSLLPRDPALFVFYTDQYGVLEKVVQRVSGKEHEIKLAKFIHYVHSPDVDRFYGESDLRQAYRSWYVKDQIVRMYATYLERFAGGFMVLNLSNEAGIASDSKEHQALKAVLANLRNLAGAILPPGVTSELIQPGSTAEYREALTYFDQAIAKALLVPNLLGISHTGQTGAYSQSQTQLEAFFWTLNADTKRLEACLNEQLFRDLGDQNLGDGDYPQFSFKPASFEHSKWVVDSWTKLLTGGAVISTEQDETKLRAMLDMPAREEDATSIKELNAEIDQKFAPEEPAFGFKQRRDFHTPGGHGHDQQNHAGDDAAIKEVKLPKSLARELGFLEVDTYEPEYASPGKSALVEQLEKGNSISGETALRYLVGALDNLIDVREGGGDHISPAAVRAARTILEQLKRQYKDIKLTDNSVTFHTPGGQEHDQQNHAGGDTALPEPGSPEHKAQGEALGALIAYKGMPNNVVPNNEVTNLDVMVDVFLKRGGWTKSQWATVQRMVEKYEAAKNRWYKNPEDLRNEMDRMRRNLEAHGQGNLMPGRRGTFVPGGGKKRFADDSQQRAFTTALGRVDFGLIEQRSAGVENQAIEEVSAVISKAVKRMLTPDRLRDYLGEDVTAIENLKLEGNDVGRVKAAFKQALQASWDLGMVTGRTELGRANFAAPAQNIAKLAGDYIETNGFRMAANLSDAVRAIIQQQLLNAIRFGVRPEEAELMIYRTLVEKGMLAGKSVLLDGAISFLEALLRAGGMDEDEAQELADKQPHYIETLVRTNTFEALNEARFSLYTSPEVAWFVAGLEYSALIDGRTTEFCQHMHGRKYRVDNPIWAEYRPPNHYNCRSLLVAITKTDTWDGTESPLPTMEPQDGFKASEQQEPLKEDGDEPRDHQDD